MNTDVQRTHANTIVPRFVLHGAAGTIAAAAVNAALFVTTSSWAFPPDAIIPWAGAPVNLAVIVISTVIGGVLAIGGCALLRRFLPHHANPRQLHGLAAVVLLLMAAFPFMIRSVGPAQIVVLQLMHLVAGLIPLAVILRGQRRERG